MKVKNYFANLTVLIALAAFGLFSFPVQRTANAKFDAASLIEQPEMSVDYWTLDSSDSTKSLAERRMGADSNTNGGSRLAAP